MSNSAKETSQQGEAGRKKTSLIARMGLYWIAIIFALIAAASGEEINNGTQTILRDFA